MPVFFCVLVELKNNPTDKSASLRETLTEQNAPLETKLTAVFPSGPLDMDGLLIAQIKNEVCNI